jgi:RNA polymerase sigma-70 factor (ECF subfamily)
MWAVGVCPVMNAPSASDTTTAILLSLTSNPSVSGGDASVMESPAMGDVAIAWGFEEVYRSEYPGLVAVAAAMTGDRDGAQDLVHDTMVKAFVRWDRVSRLDRPGAWCHHVLLNICRSRLRRRATERRYLPHLRRRATTSPEPSTDTLVFWSTVRRLPSRPRAVVALYFGAELTSVQIAEVLGVPEGTVRSDLSAARRVVIAELRGDGRD